MRNPSPVLAPSHPLTVPSTTSSLDGHTVPPSRFILFGTSWLKLQNYITQALQLPINLGDWNEKYGEFSNKAQVDACLHAMTNVHNLSQEFGDPVLLKAKIGKDPDFLTTDTPPDQIYGHVVWLGNQIHNAASTYDYTFQSLRDVLVPSAGTKEERAANLKLILTGEGGLQSTADDMKKKTQDLLKKLMAFDKKFSEANQEIQIYAGSSSAILADANQLIGQLTQNIEETQKAADEAYKKWREYTIAAVVASVGITIFSGGLLWFVGLGLGIGLGVAAAKERKAYNTFCNQVQKYEVDKRKKTRLVTDLTGLNASVAMVAPAMTDFKNSLEKIEGVWNDISMNLAYIVNNYSVEQLSNITWVNQVLRILDAQKKWAAIGNTAQQFTQNSLVSYNFNEFGTPIAA